MCMLSHAQQGLLKFGPSATSAPLLANQCCHCRRLKQLYLISVAQFRPEKNHRLQLEAFAAAKQKAGEQPLQVADAWRHSCLPADDCRLHSKAHISTSISMTKDGECAHG
eukprot:1161892-Pelagomonas_calceolata.AAC.5